MAETPQLRARTCGRLKRLSAWLVFAGWLAGASADEAAFAPGFLLRSWDQDSGLPSTRVNAVARTPDGFVWIATSGGLVRFDGLRFVTFHKDNTPAFGENRVTALLVDSQRTLWIGTADGRLIRHEGDSFVRVELRGERATQGRSLNSLAQDADGDLWLATDRAGLIRLRGTEAEVFDTTSGLPSDVVSQVHCDREGRLWAVAGGVLLGFAGAQWHLPAQPLPLDQPIRAIASARDGGLWVATLAPHRLGVRGGHIFKLRKGQWSEECAPYPWPQDSQRSRVQALLEDQEGRLWCATTGSGIFFRAPSQGWRRAASEIPLAQLEALCLAPDEAGVVWIGTRTFGLHQARPQPVTCLRLPSDATENVFLCVCVRRDGSIWGGTDGAGIFHWREGAGIRYGASQGLANQQVAVLLEDRSTNLWAGTFGGLFRLQGDRFEPAAGHTVLREMTVALYEDRRGALWAGTRGGLACITGEGVRVYGRGDGLTGSPVRALAEDGDGNIWAAVPAVGLFRQKGERFEICSEAQAQGGSVIRAMQFDEDGALWYGTQGAGLFRWHAGQFQSWTAEADGLPSNYHLALVPDGANRLWISSENGIFGLSRPAMIRQVRDNRQRPQLWRVTTADGLAHKVCTGVGQSASAAPDGRLWFPDGTALAGFDPASVPHAIRVLPPVIETVLVDGVPLVPNEAGQRKVRSGAATFEFQCTSPNILNPDQVLFRYQLVGLEQDWVDAGPRRTAYYNSLLPGRYEFKVMAGSLDGLWREGTRTVAFEVVPRFYERRSVQALAVGLLLAAVALTVWRVERNRSRRRLERVRLQQAMEHERQRIARDIHDDLGSGLTEIILLSDTLRDEIASLPAGENTAGEISARARTLTRAMDEVVWAVNPRNDTLESLLTYLNKFAQEYLTRAGVRCRWDVPLDLPHVPLSAETRHHLYLACKEALNNVVKHAAATEVWVRLQLNDEKFSLTIEDNGKGFDRSAQPGRGHGLLNMHRRLEELGGRCETFSSSGNGTRVTFSVSPTLAGDPAHTAPQ